MLLLNRLAAAIDMMAAGTSAPMMIAEYPMPANQLGNMFWNSSGTDSWALLPCALTPAFTAGAARAMEPNSAIRPSTSEEAGSAARLRRITLRHLVASTPVMMCGYMNRARAEPSARVAGAHCPAGGRVGA